AGTRRIAYAAAGAAAIPAARRLRAVRRAGLLQRAHRAGGVAPRRRDGEPAGGDVPVHGDRRAADRRLFFRRAEYRLSRHSFPVRAAGASGARPRRQRAAGLRPRRGHDRVPDVGRGVPRSVVPPSRSRRHQQRRAIGEGGVLAAAGAGVVARRRYARRVADRVRGEHRRRAMGARSARVGAPGAVTDAHPDRCAPAFAPEFWAVLIAAFGLRLGVALAVPNIHWPDEIYQVMEPAHRLVFGTGAVSWEWVAGIRSWLLPGAVAALMEVGRALGALPARINLPVAVAFAAAGCVPVACAYRWGRAPGRAAACAAAVVAATWIDLVYMSGHPLTEVAAADCLPAALYLGLKRGGTFASRHRLWLAGVLLGLTFVLRFHLGPALAVAAFGMCGVGRGAWPRWRAAIAGACAPVLAAALLDWATLGTPFQSIWLNVWVNTAMGVSSEAGRAPFLTLWILPLEIWGTIGFLAVLVTALLGA